MKPLAPRITILRDIAGSSNRHDATKIRGLRPRGFAIRRDAGCASVAEISGVTKSSSGIAATRCEPAPSRTIALQRLSDSDDSNHGDVAGFLNVLRRWATTAGRVN